MLERIVKGLIISTVVMAMFVGSIVSVISTNKVHAEGALTTSKDTKNQKPAKFYEYTAQKNDSYTKIARKAIQTYGIINKVDIGQAGIVFAETNLTIANGSPLLNLGQKVKIDESQIKDWVQKAKNLNDSEKKAWQTYLKYVDFNTDKVGESK